MNKGFFKKEIKDNIYMGIAPLVVASILFCVYYMHGVYPFGSRSISYYDMAQQYVPLYYHTWDVLHGVKNALFDWNVGMGCALDDAVGVYLFFPTNLFFLFVSRENILYSMSFFLMIKMMLSAFSMSFYILYKSRNKMLCVYAGVAYACCGYALQYYSNIYSLDDVMLLPLLVWSIERLIHKGKKHLYIVLLSLLFFGGQQLAFTVVIYIVLKGFLEIQMLEKQYRGKATQSIVLCSLAGFLLSAILFIPSLYLIFKSSRFGIASSSNPLGILMSLSCDFFEQKLFMMFGAEIGVGCIVYLLSKRDVLKKYYTDVIIITLLGLPIALENINVLWHGGSYQHFPMRFGYMFSFEMLLLVCKFVGDKEVGKEKCEEERTDNTEEKKDRTVIISIIATGLVILMAIMLGVICNHFRAYGIRDLAAYRGYGLVIIVSTFIGLIICHIDNKRVVGILLMSIAIIQGALGAYGLIAPKNIYSIECGNQFVDIAEKVFENIEQVDATNRIKDRDMEMNANYGFILRQSSLGCWMNGIGPNLQRAMYKMGYTVNYTRVLDGCGSVFTDALLGVRRLYSSAPVNGTLYTSGKSVGEGNIYDCKHYFPFGVLMDELPYGEGFEYQNSLFRSVTGEGNLFKEIDIDAITHKNDYDPQSGIYSFESCFPAEEESILYIYGDRDMDIYGKYAFSVNGELVSTDALGTTGNAMYATPFMNGFIEAGTYENEDITLSIITNLESIEGIHVGLLKTEVLEKGIDKVNQQETSAVSEIEGTLNINLELKKGGTLFIPIGYSDDYILTIDGIRNEYFPVLENAFVGTEIESGKHIIEISYRPKGLSVGAFMTVIGAILTVCLSFDKRKRISDRSNAFWENAYKVVFFVVIMALYVIPIVAAIAVGFYQLMSI